MNSTISIYRQKYLSDQAVSLLPRISEYHKNNIIGEEYENAIDKMVETHTYNAEEREFLKQEIKLMIEEFKRGI